MAVEETRLGRQTPTSSVVLPYQRSKGNEAIELYQKTGRTAQEWQQLLLYDIMAINDENLWTHIKFGYAVPRRNGKNEVVSMREMWGLMNGEHIMHSAHRTSTSRAAWERLKRYLDDAHIEHKDSGALGQERIRIKSTGGEIDFRTRTSKGGLGEGFDLLVIDEAQEYTDDQATALVYIVTASQNPQTIFCGTPPTAESSGTVFMHMRDQVIAGSMPETGWAEWSVEEMHDPMDRDAWYETNPSLGTILKERNIMSEIGSDTLDFNIQRLGYWIRYNLKSVISAAEWAELKIEKLPALRSKIFVGVKYSKTDTVSVSIGIRTEDNKIFVEAIDCRPFRAGTDWIVAFLRGIDVKAVVVDGQSGQNLLAEAMKDAHMKHPILPTVKQIIAANAVFEERLSRKELVHMGQQSLAQSVTNCDKRLIGTNGGFGYKSINENYDISLMDSMILAQWICGAKTKTVTKRQRISY